MKQRVLMKMDDYDRDGTATRSFTSLLGGGHSVSLSPLCYSTMLFCWIPADCSLFTDTRLIDCLILPDPLHSMNLPLIFRHYRPCHLHQADGDAPQAVDRDPNRNEVSRALYHPTLYSATHPVQNRRQPANQMLGRNEKAPNYTFNLRIRAKRYPSISDQHQDHSHHNFPYVPPNDSTQRSQLIFCFLQAPIQSPR